MKNRLGREGGARPYRGLNPCTPRQYPCNKKKTPVFFADIDSLLDSLPLRDGITISFHHHMRNGDKVLPMIMNALHSRGLKNLTIAASAIFPCHANLVEMLEDKTVTKIHCAYMSGPVAEAVSRGACRDQCVITTHGGRPRAILEGELKIDIAFLASPCTDRYGNATGSSGPSKCGVLGYAIADAQEAEQVVLVTDYCVDRVEEPEIPGEWVDAVLTVPKIGDPEGIVSGTTRITKDPVGLRIAEHCVRALAASGILQNGFSFQTGAGGISLAVADALAQWMKEENIRGSFASGGITDPLVHMLEEGLFESLYDVQCFTLGAVESITKNPEHKKMSASRYANPCQQGVLVDHLDVVILGASEIDLDFHVNVTTGSDGIILGGSGGHADTAAGARITVVVSKLVNIRRSCVVEKVRTITTPGETVDLLVTDRGICVNPSNQWLTEKLQAADDLSVMPIASLYQKALEITGIPGVKEPSGPVVAVSEYRDGTVLDVIRRA